MVIRYGDSSFGEMQMSLDTKEQDNIRDLLRAYLKRIQKDNPRYSMRALAKKLGIYPGTLSNILSRKRNISPALAEKIIQKLNLEWSERKTSTKRKSSSRISRSKIPSDWEYSAIISISKNHNFGCDHTLIASYLGIDEERARFVLNELIELGALNSKI